MARNIGTALPHGTRARYQRGCRCAACAAAYSVHMQAYRERIRTATATDHQPSAYRYRHGCRCDGCRAAHREATAAARAAAKGLPPGDPRHGTRGGWDYHRCRCSECHAAKCAASRDYYWRAGN